MKKLAIIFLAALVLNLLWENLHVVLYDNYKGGPITEFILFRASLFDAFLIAVMSLPILFVRALKDRTWIIFILGIAIAIINEWYGLSTARWAYNELMPVIPLIETGLTPTIQLGLTGYLTLRFWERAQRYPHRKRTRAVVS